MPAHTQTRRPLFGRSALPQSAQTMAGNTYKGEAETLERAPETQVDDDEEAEGD